MVDTLPNQLPEVYSDLSKRIGETVVVEGNRTGILRFYGNTSFAKGIWCGVELPAGSGKNDGTVNGVTYFTCPPNSGLFVHPNKITFPSNEQYGHTHTQTPTKPKENTHEKVVPQTKIDESKSVVGSQHPTLSVNGNTPNPSSPAASQSIPFSSPHTPSLSQSNASTPTRKGPLLGAGSSSSSPQTPGGSKKPSTLQKLGSALSRSLASKKQKKPTHEGVPVVNTTPVKAERGPPSISPSPAPSTLAPPGAPEKPLSNLIGSESAPQRKATEVNQSTPVPPTTPARATPTQTITTPNRGGMPSLVISEVSSTQELQMLLEKAQERIASLTDMCAEKQTALYETESQRDDLQRQLKDIKKAHDQLSFANEQLQATLENRQSSFYSEISSLRQNLEANIANSQTKYSQLEREMQVIGAENVRLQAERDEWEKTAQRLEDAVKSSDSSLAVNTLRKEVESLKAVYELKAEECRQLQLKVASVSELERELKSVKAQNKALTARNEQMQIALMEKKDSERVAWQQASEALQQLNSKEDMERRLSDQNEMLKFRLQELQRKSMGKDPR
eukprot:comp24264_c5_seq1/m.45181 comp24264_c5_seq1/g.45181  ORF comp24264_c5_seq1/g.45181 comp24264_c5_seq1/m.45181 type:complete len:562 (-) comp24264_c5_seq1:74-1759(-)